MASLRGHVCPGQRLVSRGLPTVLLLAICLSAEHAQAATITGSGPPDCGDLAALQTQVEHLIERPLISMDDLDFDVRVVAVENRWRLSLRTRPRSAEPERLRELGAASCREVMDAAALSIAMIIGALERVADPTLPVAAAPAAHQNEFDSTAREPAPGETRTGPSAAESSAQLRALLGIGLALDAGVLPALAPAAELEVSLGLSGLRLIALGALFVPQRVAIPGTAQGGDFGLALGALVACAELDFGPVQALSCAGFEVGQLSIQPVGLIPLDTRSRLAYGPRAELGVVWEVGSDIGLFVRAGGTLPARRYEFQVAQRRLYQSSPVSLRATISVEYSL